MKSNNSKLTFIWDLDGTLLNSYPLIVDSLWTIYKEKGVLIDKKEIYKKLSRNQFPPLLKGWTLNLIYLLMI